LKVEPKQSHCVRGVISYIMLVHATVHLRIKFQMPKCLASSIPKI